MCILYCLVPLNSVLFKSCLFQFTLECYQSYLFQVLPKYFLHCNFKIPWDFLKRRSDTMSNSIVLRGLRWIIMWRVKGMNELMFNNTPARKTDSERSKAHRKYFALAVANDHWDLNVFVCRLRGAFCEFSVHQCHIYIISHITCREQTLGFTYLNYRISSNKHLGTQ